MYALGQLGWSLASFAPASLVTYFYMPPEGESGSIFPVFISAAAIFGVLTWVGLLNSAGRVFDAVTDPIVANWSDRSKSKQGRRIPFLMYSALPFTLLSVLVFFPPVHEPSTANVIWLGVVLVLYYLFLTLYVTPYTALLSELGKDSKERLDISTMMSVTWALGFLIGSTVYALQGLLEPLLGGNSVLAFQTIIALYAFISFILMLLPVVGIKESRDTQQGIQGEPLFPAMRRLLTNKNFRWFVASDLMYWLALTFIQVGIAYYVLVLLGLEKGWATTLLAIMFLASFALYVPVNILARKFGKKNLIVLAFFLDALVFGMVTFLGYWPIPPVAQGLILVIFYAIPLSIFSILPNVIVSDMSEASLRTSGFGNSGVFFGVRTFMMKLGISLANLIFPSLIALGQTSENTFGLRLTGVVAFGFCILGLVFMSRYDEEKIIQEMS